MLASECHYTFGEIDAMALDDVALLYRYWATNPPLTVLVRAVAQGLGIEIKPQDKPKALTPEEAMRLMSQTGGRIEGVGSM